VLAVSAIGDPSAFEAQLGLAGLELEAVRFPDHHAYSDADIASLAERGRTAMMVLCTLKDAVKLGPRWPPGAVSLWYVSQRVRPEDGAETLAALVDDLLARREVPDR
jgi:tetraacyldisaccharide 4'-kinase